MTDQEFKEIFNETWENISQYTTSEEHATLLRDQIEESHPDLSENEKTVLLLANYNNSFTQSFFEELLRKLVVYRHLG